MQLTHVKRTLPWLLVHLQGCAAIATTSFCNIFLPKEAWCPGAPPPTPKAGTGFPCVLSTSSTPAPSFTGLFSFCVAVSARRVNTLG